MQVKKSVVVITGGASGIGESVAKCLAAEGASIVVGDIAEEQVRRVVADIVKAGGKAEGRKVDVTKDEDVASLMDAALSTFGRINAVVPCAGIIRDGLVINTDKETGKVKKVMDTAQFRSVIEVNLVGSFIDSARSRGPHGRRRLARSPFHHILREQGGAGGSDQLLVHQGRRRHMAADSRGRVPHAKHPQYPDGRYRARICRNPIASRHESGRARCDFERCPYR